MTIKTILLKNVFTLYINYFSYCLTILININVYVYIYIYIHTYTHTTHTRIYVSYFSIAYIGPSVTPFQDNNPAYRIYEVNNDETFQLVDYHVYFFDLTTANSKYGNPTWKYLYGAKVRYWRSCDPMYNTWLTLGIIWIEEPTASGVVWPCWWYGDQWHLVWNVYGVSLDQTD